MNDLAREAKRAYDREYRHNNPDKMRKYREKYWTKKAAKLAEQTKQNEEKGEPLNE